MSTGAEGPGRYSDETAESLGLLDTTKYYDVNVNFLVQAESPDDARDKIHKLVGTADGVEDWEIDYPIEENTAWEV